MRWGLETSLRLGQRGTPRGNGEHQLGWTYGAPRQSSTLLLEGVMETTASFEVRLAPWLHSTILEGMEETAASFEARSASPSYSPIYRSGSLLFFSILLRKTL